MNEKNWINICKAKTFQFLSTCFINLIKANEKKEQTTKKSLRRSRKRTRNFCRHHKKSGMKCFLHRTIYALIFSSSIFLANFYFPIFCHQFCLTTAQNESEQRQTFDRAREMKIVFCCSFFLHLCDERVGEKVI